MKKLARIVVEMTFIKCIVETKLGQNYSQYSEYQQIKKHNKIIKIFLLVKIRKTVINHNIIIFTDLILSLNLGNKS